MILPDNDLQGRRHAECVAQSIAKAGAQSIKILRLPGLPELAPLPMDVVGEGVEQGVGRGRQEPSGPEAGAGPVRQRAQDGVAPRKGAASSSSTFR